MPRSAQTHKTHGSQSQSKPHRRPLSTPATDAGAGAVCARGFWLGRRGLKLVWGL